MGSAREYAENATAAVWGILQLAPTESADDVAGVIERTIRSVTLEQQAAAEDRLAHLLSASPAVIYSFEAAGAYRPTFVSRNIESLFGYQPDEYLKSPDFWRKHIHPEDLARVEAEVTRLFVNDIHALEYRFRCRDGSYRWVNDEQRVIRDQAGKPLEIVGSWSDISARKAAEEALSEARARASHLVNAAPSVIYSFKASGDYAPTFVSGNIRALLGYEPREYLDDSA